VQDRHIATVDLEQYQSRVLHNTLYGMALSPITFTDFQGHLSYCEPLQLQHLENIAFNS